MEPIDSKNHVDDVRRRMERRAWGVVVGLAAVVLGGPLLINGSAYLRDREEMRSRRCRENLEKLFDATEDWAIEHNMGPGTPVTRANIAPYLPDAIVPDCPTGAKYTITGVGEDPTCPSGLPGHELPEYGGTIVSSFPTDED